MAALLAMAVELQQLGMLLVGVDAGAAGASTKHPVRLGTLPSRWPLLAFW